MKFIRITPALGLAVAAAAAALHPVSAAEANAPAAKPGVTLADLLPDRVLAKGQGFEIKRSQLDEAVSNVRANLGRVLSPQEMSDLERKVLDRLIQMQILLAKATDADKAKGKEEAAKNIAEARKQAGSEESFQRKVKATGLTEEVLQKRMAEESTTGAVLERELKITVTDAEVKKFYDDNPPKFEQPEMVRASHILFGTRDPVTGAELSDEAKKGKRKKAEEVLKRAKAGEDFAKLAKEFSEDPGSKDKGGEYTFPRGQMTPEFEDAAFKMRTNQISDIVTTQFGYHIIKVIERIPAKKMELSQVSDQVRQYLKTQQLQQLAPPYLETLRKDATVEILEDSLKPPALPVEPAKSAAK